MAKRASRYYCGMWYTMNVPLDAREERERGGGGGGGGGIFSSRNVGMYYLGEGQWG